MSKQTFSEGVKISWEREIKIGDPWRILQLAFFTLVYGAVHYLYIVPKSWIFQMLKNHGGEIEILGLVIIRLEEKYPKSPIGKRK